MGLYKPTFTSRLGAPHCIDLPPMNPGRESHGIHPKTPSITPSCPEGPRATAAVALPAKRRAPEDPPREPPDGGIPGRKLLGTVVL